MTMKLMTTTCHLDMERFAHPALGRLLTPRCVDRVSDTVALGAPFACDNDCFNGLDRPKFEAMLDKVEPFADACLWVSAPDVVGDAAATAESFAYWQPRLAARGLPVALVAQNGIEDMPDWLDDQWSKIACLFIGGSPECQRCGRIDGTPGLKRCPVFACGGTMQEWKLGPAVRNLAQLARVHGVLVHVGRVNSFGRIEYCRDTLLADSVDGSSWPRFKDKMLRRGLAACGVLRGTGKFFPPKSLEGSGPLPGFSFA